MNGSVIAKADSRPMLGAERQGCPYNEEIPLWLRMLSDMMIGHDVDIVMVLRFERPVAPEGS